MQNAVAKMAEETILFHFVPMQRGALKRLMDMAGYPKHGFGSGDFIAFGRVAVDCEPLPFDKAHAAFFAFENGNPDAALRIVNEHYSAEAD